MQIRHSHFAVLESSRKENTIETGGGNEYVAVEGFKYFKHNHVGLETDSRGLWQSSGRVSFNFSFICEIIKVKNGQSRFYHSAVCFIQRKVVRNV